MRVGYEHDICGATTWQYEARTHEIEVTLDVSYDRVLDAHRPHVAMVELKVAKLLGEP